MAYNKKWEEPDNLDVLKKELKDKNPANLYIFHGEESYLKTHYLGMLRKQLLTGIADEFNYHRFDSETMDLDVFQDAVEALPMMAERSFIFVNDYDLMKGNESERSRMAEILSDLPDYCCVVFYYETLEWNPKKEAGKLYEVVKEKALCVRFKKQEGRELVTWIRRHFLHQKKEIDDRTCQYLIFVTGGTMTALASEIQKICAYSDAPVITRSDIDAVVEPVLDAEIFQITDAICSGDYTKALEKLQTVLKMQEEPIKILGGIGSQMRRLRTAKVLWSRQKGADVLRKLYAPLAEYPARKTMQAASHVSQAFCDRAVLLCAETDVQLKSSADDPQRLLELLILRLAGEGNHD